MSQELGKNQKFGENQTLNMEQSKERYIQKGRFAGRAMTA